MARRKGEGGRPIKKNGRTKNPYTPLLAGHTWESSAIHLPRYLYHCVGGRTYLPVAGPRPQPCFSLLSPDRKKIAHSLAAHVRYCIVVYYVCPYACRVSVRTGWFLESEIFFPSPPKPVARTFPGGRRRPSESSTFPGTRPEPHGHTLPTTFRHVPPPKRAALSVRPGRVSVTATRDPSTIERTNVFLRQVWSNASAPTTSA